MITCVTSASPAFFNITVNFGSCSFLLRTLFTIPSNSNNEAGECLESTCRRNYDPYFFKVATLGSLKSALKFTHFARLTLQWSINFLVYCTVPSQRARHCYIPIFGHHLPFFCFPHYWLLRHLVLLPHFVALPASIIMTLPALQI